jgi:outer membrane protein OmpA-like peptidoglycan-associated protein
MEGIVSAQGNNITDADSTGIITLEGKISARENKDTAADFTGNITLEGGIGTQVLFSRDAGVLNLNQRLTPVFSLAGGKWLTPIWGLNIRFNGVSMNGFTIPIAGSPYDPVIDFVTVRPDGSYRHYLRYFSTSLGIKASLLTIVDGYNEDRAWDIIPSVDAGYVRMLSYKGSPAGNYLSPGFSLAGNFRISPRMDIQLEARSILFPDKFDGRVSGRRFESNLGVTLGVSFRFGEKRSFRMGKDNVTEDTVNDTPVPAEVTADTVNGEQIVHVDTIFVEVPATRTPSACEPYIVASLLFEADKNSPKPDQELQYFAIADYLRRNPDRRIRLDAYTDKETGTESYNAILAVARAKNVKDLLVSQYNIDESKLIENAIGTRSRPFEKRVHNRVVLAIVLSTD